MFTATRMAALTAVIALSGSLALIVGPLQEPDQAPPAAPAEVGPPSYFTGTSVSWGSGESELETLSDRTVERFEAGFSNTVDDARLSGFGQSTNYLETIVGGDGAFYMAYSAAGRIENDGGSWAITCSGAGDTGATSLIFFQCWYDGEGGYEGLTAFSMLQPTNDSGGGSMDVSGWIYPGDPPPTLTFEP